MPSFCHSPGCKKQASFNYEGQKGGLYCVEHKDNDMVYVRNPLCHCGKQPSYNYDGQSVALFCVEHKAPEMVNVRNSTCQSTGCNRQPSFNFEGCGRPIYCKEHSAHNMVNIKYTNQVRNKKKHAIVHLEPVMLSSEF